MTATEALQSIIAKLREDQERLVELVKEAYDEGDHDREASRQGFGPYTWDNSAAKQELEDMGL